MTSVIFCACAKDCAEHLPIVFNHFAKLASKLDEAAFIVAENDSTDDTKQVLESISKQIENFHILDLDGLSSRYTSKTERLAFVRNSLIESIGKLGHGHFEILCMFD